MRSTWGLNVELPANYEVGMQGQLWVGLDVGELKTNICVVDSTGERVLECCAGSAAGEIAESLSGLPLADIETVAMESGASVQLPYRLTALGFPVSVLDARKTSKMLSIRRQKTDVNDARGLADIARLGGVESLGIFLRGSQAQQIRTELALRNKMVLLQTAAKNSLRSMLRNYGSGIKRMGTGKQIRIGAEQEVASLARSGVAAVSATLAPLIDLCDSLSKAIKKMDRALKRTAHANEITRRFMEIPGVGPICALSFYATIDDPSRFRRPADVGAYLGMVPKLKQSGRTLRRSRITRTGDRHTRSLLVISAGVMMSRAAHGCALRDWGKELAKKSGYGRARVAVARKLAVVMLTIWKAGTEFTSYPNKPSATA